MSTEARFWSKVDRGISCWEWTACKGRNGYGQFKYHGSPVWAHRFSAYVVGLIPSVHTDLKVLHKCDNPACVNPAHLFTGTDNDNVQDKVRKGRQAKGETSGRAKLTEMDVRYIRYKASTGTTRKELAKEFEMDVSSVGYIIRRKLWPHVI